MPNTSQNAAVPGFIYNSDVAGLYTRMNRFIEEIVKAVSSGVSEMNEFDQTRLASYLDAIDAYTSWIIAQPHLDLPETSPREYPLESPPVYTLPENESVRDVLRMMELARDELVNSQSARYSQNLISFDRVRLTNIVQKIRAFLNDYIKPTTPLDLPESSPMREVTGPGRGGV